MATISAEERTYSLSIVWSGFYDVMQAISVIKVLAFYDLLKDDSWLLAVRGFAKIDDLSNDLERYSISIREKSAIEIETARDLNH